MKNWKFIALFLALTTLYTGLEAAEKWLSGPDKRWYIKLEDALAAAKAENKKVYVLRTGSDWCGWCTKLYKDVLSNKKFKRFARKHLILLYLDAPKRKKMPSEQLNYNNEVFKKLGITGGFPTGAVLDSDGKLINKRAGYAPYKEYIKFLEEAVGAGK